MIEKELNTTHFNTCQSLMIGLLRFVHIQIWPKLKKYVNNLNKIHDLKANFKAYVKKNELKKKKTTLYFPRPFIT